MVFSRRRQRSSANDSRSAPRPRTAKRLAAPERLEDRRLLAGLPYGAMDEDLGEFLLGDVHVTVVLMESSTQTSLQNNNSETWTQASIDAVKQRVAEGLQWWEDTLAMITDRHELNFQIDFTHADSPVETNYEPINRSSSDFQFWVYDFLNKVGFNTRGNFHSDIKAFNHAQRVAHDADWAFTIFVVNDGNDPDKQFAPGGFSRAFAFAGGELLVSLASRPPSTYAHETGHIFWAFDEYEPVANYHARRGYYNTQNLNAYNNPTPGFTQQPSIMTKDPLIGVSYDQHLNADSTLEMVGWKDSDGDGIFDVLDVPLSLTGSGYYDGATGIYHFTGTSAAQTLPNRNPSGLKNDITLNRVSRAEYRIDGGAWQTANTYGTYSAVLDLDFPVPATATTIEIRTRDDVTGVTSTTFQGFTARPSAVGLPGISGVVWHDDDRDGVLDPSERGLAGVTVQLVNASGDLLPLQQIAEPDEHPSTTRLNTVYPGFTLSAIGSGVSDNTVAAFTATPNATGDKVFASFSGSCGGYCADWTTETRQLRVDFTAPVTTVRLDAVGSTGPGIARLEAYDSNNQLIARYTTQQLTSGQVETMTLSRPTPSIKYVIARSHNNTLVRLDNLRVGPVAAGVTDAYGTYTIPYLNGGQYRVQVVSSSGQILTNPHDGDQNVVLAEGEAKAGVDFGVDQASSPWQNPDDRFDVNDDTFVTSIDVLQIINKLNNDGAGPLTEADTTPPFVDVNGDLVLSSNDVLQVINEINARMGAGEGEGELPGASSGLVGMNTPASVSGSAEGEGENLEGAVNEFVIALAEPQPPSIKAAPLLQPVNREQPDAAILAATAVANDHEFSVTDEVRENPISDDRDEETDWLLDEALLTLLASSRG